MDISERLKDQSTWRDGWQMRDKTPVEILADDMGPEFPILIRVLDSRGVWQVELRRGDGRTTFAAPENSGDLVPRPVKHSGWISVYPGGKDYFCASVIRSTKANCDESAMDGRIACIPVTFTEGEGLS